MDASKDNIYKDKNKDVNWKYAGNVSLKRKIATSFALPAKIRKISIVRWVT